MRVSQFRITFAPKPRGFHLVTKEIQHRLNDCGMQTGTVHLFLQHTSASLSINENCDRSVREDMESYFNTAVDESGTAFTHTLEGEDDMPAHIKSSVLGVSLTIPFTEGALSLGTWQGVYLNEHRGRAGSRHLLMTVTGE